MMAHAAAILTGADIQTLVPAGFDTPVIALPLLPLLDAQAGRFAAAQEILGVRCFAQALPQDDRTLRGCGKAGLLRADGHSTNIVIPAFGLWRYGGGGCS